VCQPAVQLPDDILVIGGRLRAAQQIARRIIGDGLIFVAQVVRLAIVAIVIGVLIAPGGRSLPELLLPTERLGPESRNLVSCSARSADACVRRSHIHTEQKCAGQQQGGQEGGEPSKERGR